MSVSLICFQFIILVWCNKGNQLLFCMYTSGYLVLLTSFVEKTILQILCICGRVDHICVGLFLGFLSSFNGLCIFL